MRGGNKPAYRYSNSNFSNLYLSSLPRYLHSHCGCYTNPHHDPIAYRYRDTGPNHYTASYCDTIAYALFF